MTEWQLTVDVVDAVVRHMNGDHAADNVTICRGLGGQPDTEAATMTGMDDTAMEFLASTPHGDTTVRIPFSSPLRDRVQIREEAARMVRESEALLDA